jgi:hypothetical protein
MAFALAFTLLYNNTGQYKLHSSSSMIDLLTCRNHDPEEVRSEIVSPEVVSLRS